MNAPVEIRHYGSLVDFRTDATIMANAGWRVVAQSTGSRLSGAGSGCVALGIVVGVGGIFIWLPLVVVGIVLVVAGLVSRVTTYTVTYSPG